MSTCVLVHKTDEYTLVIEYEGEPVQEVISVDIQYRPVPLFSRNIPIPRRGLSLTEEDHLVEDLQPYTALERS